jgi:hypothetical protein
MQMVDAGLNRALVTFGIAKALDAAISVIQSAQLSINIGVGFALTIGEVLDPINDMVEQFSTLIMAAAVAFGVQKIFVSIGSYTLIKVFLSIVAVIWVCLCLINQKPPKSLVYTFVLILMIRFAMPLVTVGSNLLFENFMASQYQSSATEIKDATTEISALTPDQFAPNPAQAPQGLWGKIMPSLQSIPNSKGVKVMFDKFKDKINAVTEKVIANIVNLIVVFILQTIIFPVAILWLLYRLALGMLSNLVR